MVPSRPVPEALQFAPTEGGAAYPPGSQSRNSRRSPGGRLNGRGTHADKSKHDRTDVLSVVVTDVGRAESTTGQASRHDRAAAARPRNPPPPQPPAGPPERSPAPLSSHPAQ